MTVAEDPRLAWLDSKFAAAARLAELASFAARIDTGLLRRLRLQLLPDADVSAESELWFSAIVESRSETGFQISPEVLPPLRDRLLSMSGRPAVGVVRQVVAQAHATASPAIRLEEAINGMALEYGPAGQPAIDQALRPVLSALSRGDADAIDVARWIVNAVPRLHPILRETATARTIVMSAALLLRGRARISGGTPDPAVRISTLGWALTGQMPSRRIGVEFVQGGLQFRTPSNASGYIDAPVTDPVIVEIEWQSRQGVRRRLAQATDGALVPLGDDPAEVTITTLLGDQYRVTASPGAGPAAERRAVFPPASLLEACVQVEPLGHDEPIGVIFAVAETLLLGVSTVIRGLPFVKVSGGREQLEVLGQQSRTPVEGGTPELVGLQPVGADGRPIWSRLTLAPPAEDGVLRAAAAGFAAGKASWYDVALEPAGDKTEGVRRGVLFSPPRLSAADLIAGFVGAPLVVNQRAVGAIVQIVPPQPHESYAAVAVVDAAHLRAIVARVRPEPPSPLPLVYISFAREDEREAMRIREAIEEMGFRVFVDRSSLKSGDDWQEVIERAIDSSDFFIAILSKHALVRESRSFRLEWKRAEVRLQQMPLGVRYLVPVVIDSLSPSDPAIPSFLKHLQWLPAPKGDLPPEFAASLRADARARVEPAARPSRPQPADIGSFMDALLDARVRVAIWELISTPLGGVLLVDGPPQSAVEGVLDFVQRSIRRGASLNVKLENIALRTAEAAGGRELAEQIAVRAGLNVSEMPRLDDESGPRVVITLARWLLSALARGDASHILAIHGFEHSVPQQDLFDLINELIVDAAQTKGLLRFILLNYRRPLPAEAEAIATRVELQPLDKRRVDEFFRAVFESTGRPYEPRAIDEAKRGFLHLIESRESWDYGDVRPYLEEAAWLLTGRRA